GGNISTVTGWSQPYDEGLFTPTENLSALSETEFRKLDHPEFPRHSVRVKKSKFCDGTVNSYTGYIDVEARHLFFYFFESRNDPDRDDVIFWTNGGSTWCLLCHRFIHGTRVLDADGAKFHPESWNSNANIFFIDQPVGVGYSYADYGETVTTTEEAAKDIAAFVAIFFEHFSKLKGRAFHMAGESYGGRYLPLFAAEIYDQNSKFEKTGVTPINLSSIMIGNGLTDFYTFIPAFYEKACTAASGTPVLDIRTCIIMKQDLPRCKNWLKESCVDQFDNIACGASVDFCFGHLYEPFVASGLNPYDLTRTCESTIDDTFCYAARRHIEHYLNLPEIRSTLGVDPKVSNYTLNSNKVNAEFTKNLDPFHPTYEYVAALLDRGVRVLIYVGRNDWVCNHLGIEAWTTRFEWSGHDEFASQPLREWAVDGKKTGLTRKAKGLTYATIDGAGHLVPYDKPKESLALVNRWLSNEELYVRVKKSSFCDETVKSYTGYIDIEARHLFFYFFESRNDPDKDDVIFWTNGGPGCSSSLGLFMELGPCRVSDANGTKFHPESWNSNANIFFVDQPIGVGFSYADYGEVVSTTEEAAKDIAAFVVIFFENFSKFKGRAFHMAGESYGGRYIPVFAAEVYDQNKKLEQAGMTPINLTSIMIGNGITDFYTMIPSYYDMACTPASVAPILDISTCTRMKQTIPRCKKWLKASCVDQLDAISCEAANTFCSQELSVPFFASNKNPYDISRDCEGEISDTLCYPVTKYISSYLDRPDVRSTLGVDPSITSNFSSCSIDVGARFYAKLDEFHPTHHYVSALLDRGVKALIYVGRNDWICNHVGNERWTLEFEWSGHAEFSVQPLREWIVGGKKAGMARSAQGLTFATVDGAGHMVPYDKPKEALELVNRWLSNKDL
ncbi:hypothetical protein CVT25_007605, partial [Psilocybe cyanescens]